MRDCAIKAWAVGLALAIGTIAAGAPSAPKPKTETRVERKEIPYEVRYEFSRAVGAGRLVKVQDGKPGELVRVFRIERKENGAVEKKLVREQRVEPIPAVYHMGRAGYVASRGAFVRGRVLEMEATAYDPSPQTIGPGATGRTATGIRAVFGVAAVDPRVIPLGTLLFVEGYGYAIAADTGRSIRGNRIDLCFDRRHQALGFGRKKVRVHVLR